MSDKLWAIGIRIPCLLSRWVICAVSPLLLGAVAHTNAQADRSCGLYPEKVLDLGGGWNGCALREMGAQPIWQGVPDTIPTVWRFVFTEGHDAYFRAVTITKKADGTGLLLMHSQTRRRGLPSSRRFKKVRLSIEDIQRIEQLGDTSGTWNFNYGSWDGEDIYVHCQLLEMEKSDRSGYRYSSVNLSCNQPTKLMPLVNEIARLASLKQDSAGLFY